MEKKQWDLFALLWSYKIFRTALNKSTMFAHVKTDLDFLDRLSQRSPIPNLTTKRLVAAEVTYRTDRRTDGRRGESQLALRATYSKKPKREAGSHEHPVQRGTYSQSLSQSHSTDCLQHRSAFCRLPVGDPHHIPVSLKRLAPYSQQPANH